MKNRWEDGTKPSYNIKFYCAIFSSFHEKTETTEITGKWENSPTIFPEEISKGKAMEQCVVAIMMRDGREQAEGEKTQINDRAKRRTCRHPSLRA